MVEEPWVLDEADARDNERVTRRDVCDIGVSWLELPFFRPLPPEPPG